MRLRNIMNNFHAVSINRRTYFFSYETLIGVSDDVITYIAKNEWSRTTAKHLKWIREHHTHTSLRELPKSQLDNIA